MKFAYVDSYYITFWKRQTVEAIKKSVVARGVGIEGKAKIGVRGLRGTNFHI